MTRQAPHDRVRRVCIVLAVAVVMSPLVACSASASANQVSGAIRPEGSQSSQRMHDDKRLHRAADQYGVTSVANSRDAYPSAENTGPVGPLEPYRGPLTITEPNAIIENVEIHAPQVLIAANNVTFRNVRIVYSGQVDEKYAVVAMDPRFYGATFEDCEIDGKNGSARALGGPGGFVVKRCDIHNTGNGVEVAKDFTVEDSYIHDIFTPSGLSWHADGVQSAVTSTTNIRLVHNTILTTGRETSAINIFAQSGTAKNVLIGNNLLGGGGYTVYAGGVQTDDYVVAQNAFTTELFPAVGFYGPWYPESKNIVAENNIILGSGVLTGPAR